MQPGLTDREIFLLRTLNPRGIQHGCTDGIVKLVNRLLDLYLSTECNYPKCRCGGPANGPTGTVKDSCSKSFERVGLVPANAEQASGDKARSSAVCPKRAPEAPPPTICEFEIKLLRSLNGEKTDLPEWGASISVGLEFLQSEGYARRGHITDKGKELLRGLDEMAA